DGIVFVEPVAAINLHGFIHRVIEDLAAKYLGDGTLDGVFLEHLHRIRGFVSASSAGLHSLIDGPGSPIDHRFERERANGDFRKLGSYESEIADGMPESGALFGVARRGREFALAKTETRSAQR